MLREELRNISSTRQDLRGFGLVMGAALALLGGLSLWRGGEAWQWLLAAAGLMAGLGLLAPPALRPLQRPWMALAAVMGWVMTRVILAVLFFLVVTPTALAARAVGKRFLDLRWGGTRQGSLWQKREVRRTPDPRGYERPF